ncbi:MAG TPA: cytochrome c-type biogenesis protein CcmH [Bryobacteraceae bacterium]
MPPRLRQCSLKLLAAFFISLAVALAQNPTQYMTPGVMRVGSKLACRCGGCRSSMASCPMLRCDSSVPARKRIAEMQQRGMSDEAIVDTFVKEGGIAALVAPPAEGFGGILTWTMPGVALAIGFLIYSWFVRKNRKPAAPLTAEDEAMIERFRTQMDRELGESSEPEGKS